MKLWLKKPKLPHPAGNHKGRPYKACKARHENYNEILAWPQITGQVAAQLGQEE